MARHSRRSIPTYRAGDYSIADITVFPWESGNPRGVAREDFPNLVYRHDAVAARPAVRRGMRVPG